MLRFSFLLTAFLLTSNNIYAGNFICDFPDAPNVQAPKWMCSQNDFKGKYKTAVGSYKIPFYEVQFARDQAVANAEAELSKFIEVTASSEVSETVNSTTIGSSVRFDKLSRAIRLNFASNTFSNYEILGATTSPNGVYYILIGMPVEQFNKYVNSQKTTLLDGVIHQIEEKKHNMVKKYGISELNDFRTRIQEARSNQ